MTRFPKILTVTLSLIACAALVMATASHSSSPRVRISGSAQSVPRATALAPNPSTWLTDAQDEMVIAYLDGIARQERADAEAAAVMESLRAAESAKTNPPFPSITVPAPAAPSPPAPYVGGIHAQPFLICVRRHESDRSDVNGNGLFDGGYAAKNPSSSAAGAYQFLTSTWNSVVNLMGHPEWAGDPRDFSDDIQDQVAWWTYQNQGAGPWAGSGCG